MIPKDFFSFHKSYITIVNFVLVVVVVTSISTAAGVSVFVSAIPLLHRSDSHWPCVCRERAYTCAYARAYRTTVNQAEALFKNSEPSPPPFFFFFLFFSQGQRGIVGSPGRQGLRGRLVSNQSFRRLRLSTQSSTYHSLTNSFPILTTFEFNWVSDRQTSVLNSFTLLFKLSCDFPPLDIQHSKRFPMLLVLISLGYFSSV